MFIQKDHLRPKTTWSFVAQDINMAEIGCSYVKKNETIFGEYF